MTSTANPLRKISFLASVVRRPNDILYCNYSRIIFETLSEGRARKKNVALC